MLCMSKLLHIPLIANKGDREIFQYVAERVENVNPCGIEIVKNNVVKKEKHSTPLFIARKRKHFEIVKIIEDKLKYVDK